MAIPAWAIAGTTDVMLEPSTDGNFSAFGGGASGLNDETDFFIQNAECKSKNAWASALKGMMHDEAGTDLAVGTDEVVMVWMIYHVPNAISTNGMRLMIGTSTTVNWYFTVGDAASLLFETWVPWVANFDNSLETGQNGSPSAAGTVDWVGGGVDVGAGGPTKGAPFGIDAIRYGRFRLDYTDGQAANYNTFAKAEAYSNANIRRYGIIEATSDGTFRVQGFHALGASGTLCDFRDSDQVVFIRDTPFAPAGFNRFEILHASTNVDWDNIIITALGAQSPGVFVHTAGAWDCNFCQFINVGTFTLLAATVMNDCTFRNTGIITAPGSDLQRSTVVGFEGTANTSPVVYDVATDPDGLLDDMSFEMGTNLTHAIEFGTTSPLTMTLRGIDFTGYSATQDVNNSIFHIKRTSGTVTINLIGCTADVAFASSFRTDGADVVIVESPVTTLVHVTNPDKTVLQNARVYLKAADVSGPLPFEETVTIARAGLVATVTHTAHGMETGDKVSLKGITDNTDDNNGVQTITVTGANTYTYATANTGSTAYTGTIKATWVAIEELTNASGDASRTKSYGTNQNVVGWVRKSTASPRFKSFAISGTINSSGGLTINVQMIVDET